MPNSNSELYILHAWEDNPIYLKCVQGESGIKIAKFQLVDDNGAINLTGNTGVTFMGTKADGTACTVNCTIDDAATGKVSLNSSTNFTNISGKVTGNIVVGFSGNQNIQFDGITVKVRPNKAIEALIHDDTFATFLSALSTLQGVTNGELAVIDTALNTSSTNPVQNTAVATAINNIIDRLDGNGFVKVVTNVSADSCNQANTLYKIYITSSSHPSWTKAGGNHYAICSVATNQITQYVLAQDGGILFRTVSATNGTQSGTWGDFKEVAIKGTSLADYGITNAYTKDQTYSKAEVYNKTEINSKVATINQNHNTLANQVASNETAIASQGGRLTSVEETKAGQSYVDTELAKKLNNSEGSVSRANIANKAINEDKLIDTIVAKINNAMSNKFLSVTSFMCDEDGTIFAATDDTVLTNQSFENQDKTENPYFIWIANTVTEIQNTAFVNTGKVVKIYCENTIENTPLPNNYRSLPIEYGINSLFAYYIMRSLVTLFNDKANKTDVQGSVTDIDSRISSLESNKANATDVYNRTEIDNALGDIKYAYETRFELKYAVAFDEHGIPVVIWTGSYIPSNRFSNTNIKTIFISNNVSSIATDAFTCWSNLTENDSVFLYIDKGYSEAVEILGDSVSERVNVYYKGEFNVTNLMISTLKYLYEYFDEQLATKLNDSDNVIETNHIKNSAVTEEKLSAGLQAKINKNTAVYSKTFLASGWNNKQQTFTLPNSYTVTNNTKVDIEGDDTVIDQLVIDDCRGIYVTNNNGTLILKAMDNSPTENITVQLIVYEVENLN